MSPEGGSLLSFAFPMVMIFAIFYFIVLVPNRRQQKKVQEFLDNLKENDRVITTSGIYGQITRLNGDKVQLQIADKVRIDVSRAAVGGYQGQPQVVETTKP
jgi:preprotein translocase subunit YajC